MDWKKKNEHIIKIIKNVFYVIKKLFIGFINFILGIINKYKLGLCNKYFGYNPQFENALNLNISVKEDDNFDRRKIKLISYSKLLMLVNIAFNGIILFAVLSSEKVITDAIDEIFNFFQFKEIFKFDFLNRVLYSQIAKWIVILVSAYIILALLSYLFKTLFSLTVIMENEIAFVEKKLFKTIIVRIPTKKAYYIAFEQNFIEKFIGCGNIIINFANNSDYVRIPGVPNIKQAVSRIFGKMNA